VAAGVNGRELATTCRLLRNSTIFLLRKKIGTRTMPEKRGRLCSQKAPASAGKLKLRP